MNPFGSSGDDAALGRSQPCIGRGEDIIGDKAEKVIRIGFNNINGMGAQSNDGKNLDLFWFLKEHNFDVFGMAEVNIHWKNNNIQAKDIMYGWFRRMHISQNYYKQFPTTSVFQSGGVLQLAMGDITSRISAHGGDTTGQGRWTWQSFDGQGQRNIRVVTAYRPVRNTTNAGSVWHQQQYFADSNNYDGTPHDRWSADMLAAVTTWLTQGDSVILMADFNEDVVGGKTVHALKQIGLRDAMETHYANRIPTFQRGSTTIDTILCTREIIRKYLWNTDLPGFPVDPGLSLVR
jgi:exonuclease III